MEDQNNNINDEEDKPTSLKYFKIEKIQESQTDPTYLLSFHDNKKTYRYRYEWNSIGGRWDKDCRRWLFPIEKEAELYKTCRQIERELNYGKQESTRMAVETKRQKRITKENMSIIEAKISKIESVLKNPMICIPHDGYCTYCKRQVILNLEESKYADLSRCPKCIRTWDD